MNLEKLPQDIQKKIKAHQEKINALNSTELLDYAKMLKQQNNVIGSEVSDHLFKAIDERRKHINSGADTKQECKLQKAVRDFKRGK